MFLFKPKTSPSSKPTGFPTSSPAPNTVAPARRIDPAEPFRHPPRPAWQPREMREAPLLDPLAPARPVQLRYALLLNPFYPKDPHASFGKHVLTPSLALTSIAGATPPEWEVRYWDENLLQGPPPADPMPQVVGITVHLTFAQRAYALAAWYRTRGARVILGGLHILSCPEEARPHADALAVGEGVALWPRILRDIEAGTLQPEYNSAFDIPYRNDPPPRRRLLPRSSFLTTSSLIATRGCHNRCGFCYLATDGLRIPYQMRDPLQIVDEFREDGQPYGVFIDNNLGSNHEYLRALCLALRPLEKIWSAAVTLDVTDDPTLVRDMALAGCTGVFIGFESLSDGNLAWAKKRTPRTQDYARRVQVFHDNGIQVNGSFVLGFDEDRPDVFATTAEWIEDNRLECATFHILTPYPGTPLFRQMESENRLLHRDWSQYDTAHVVFQPRHMTPEELAQGYAWLYQRLFSHSSIWRRRPEDWRAVAPYLAMSYLYKRSNRFWHMLIRARMVHSVWTPLVEWSRRRHLAYRKALAARPVETHGIDGTRSRVPIVTAAGTEPEMGMEIRVERGNLPGHAMERARTGVRAGSGNVVSPGV
ncbi:MAG: radical SAM protein [Candidatus Methylacidiphilales bacterium]|nr:radical SAM protein [Candidatus Methylacidiphilales bacterium]